MDETFIPTGHIIEERVQYVHDDYDNEPGMDTVFTWWDEYGVSDPDDFAKQMHYLMADDMIAWVEERLVIMNDWCVS